MHSDFFCGKQFNNYFVNLSTKCNNFSLSLIWESDRLYHSSISYTVFILYTSSIYINEEESFMSTFLI